jgi:hypothetical protein
MHTNEVRTSYERGTNNVRTNIGPGNTDYTSGRIFLSCHFGFTILFAVRMPIKEKRREHLSDVPGVGAMEALISTCQMTAI